LIAPYKTFISVLGKRWGERKIFFVGKLRRFRPDKKGKKNKCAGVHTQIASRGKGRRNLTTTGWGTESGSKWVRKRKESVNPSFRLIPGNRIGRKEGGWGTPVTM